MINETIRQIEEMETQSSSVVAVKAAQSLVELTEREYHTAEEFCNDLERNSNALRRANRSHAPLYTTQRRIVEAVSEPMPKTIEAGKTRLRDAIDEVVTEVESSKERAAERAAALIEDGDVLLTHENSSTVMATLQAAVDDGTTFDLYVTESRPRFLGRRTARQLADAEGVDVTLIADSAAGHYLPECDRVFVGMNCLIDDIVYNRVGTYPIATAATDTDVPLTVVASSAKFIGSGLDFENTYRAASEVMLEPTDEFDIANPSYDETPVRLVDSIVTEDTVLQC